MANNDFRPILGNGENYILNDSPRPGPPLGDKLPTYEVVRDRLLQDIQILTEKIKVFPNQFRVDNVVVNMKMELGYTAKSFHPNVLIRQSGSSDVGTKKWTQVVNEKGKDKLKVGKLIFLSTSEDKLAYLARLLNQAPSTLLKGFKDDVRTINSLTLDDHENYLNSFSNDWASGRVELVFHPFNELDSSVVTKFLDLFSQCGGDPNTVKVRNYSPGPTFMSAVCDRRVLSQVVRFNPLRTLHPMVFRGVPETRGALSSFKLPKAPVQPEKSSVIVGMFDGGVNQDNPWLTKYVVERNTVSVNKDERFVQHGTAVAGAMLYGDLSGYHTEAELPAPPITVESFRVFPLSDPNDLDLYEVIDTIEDIVPKRPDIQVYNLSIGPYGPIEDDYISRFTYVVDSLSSDGERLFSIAVGNDGDLPDDASRRIQAPSDTVNGIGVGAFCWDANRNAIRAPYSSIGEGREGAKVKPDVVAYGGSDNSPFQLIGLDEQHRYFANGTSFSSPLVAAKAAEVIGRCSLADPLVGRTLVLHSARHPGNQHDKYLGYGIVPDTVEDILGCTNNKVTVLYRSRILPKNFARLLIPVVQGLDYAGEVDVYWTISLAVKTNPLNTEDYTSHCIEEFFYPNEHRYEFASPDGKHTFRRHVLKDTIEIDGLLLQNWKKGKHPLTMSGNKYLNEQDRRANFKWDTIVKKSVPLKYSDLESPYLVLHAMDRNVQEPGDFLKYAVAVTIHYKDYDGDAYQQTIENYNKLDVATIRTRNELMIRQ